MSLYCHVLVQGMSFFCLPTQPASCPRLYLGLSEVFFSSKQLALSPGLRRKLASEAMVGIRFSPGPAWFQLLEVLANYKAASGILKVRLLRHPGWEKHQFADDGWPLVVDSCKAVIHHPSHLSPLNTSLLLPFLKLIPLKFSSPPNEALLSNELFSSF